MAAEIAAMATPSSVRCNTTLLAAGGVSAPFSELGGTFISIFVTRSLSPDRPARPRPEAFGGPKSLAGSGEAETAGVVLESGIVQTVLRR